MYNVWIPFMAIGFGLLLAVMLAFFSGELAFLAFCASLFGGHLVRKWAKKQVQVQTLRCTQEH
jgi:hypothetical protein